MNKFTIQHATQLMQSVADGQATLSADDARAIVGLLKYQDTLVRSYFDALVEKMKKAWQEQSDRVD